MKKNLTTNLLGTLFALAAFLPACEKPAATDLTTKTAAGANTQTVTAAAAQLTSFVHPGVLNTQASLDYIAAQVNGGDANRTAYYQPVLDFINDHTLSTTFPSVVVVGSNGETSPSKNQIRTDCEMAYALALRWAKTGHQEYATQAISLLNGWSYNFKSYGLLNSSTNANQPDLESSWTTPTFVAAAEILRYYVPAGGQPSGWAAADINQFNTYLNTVKNNYINNTPDYSNNWDISAAYAKMAIGIFLNSTTVYQNGYNAIIQYLPIVIQSNGALPELCGREDCVHFQYTLTGLAYAAELARIQAGDNSIWTANSNLIGAGYDYMYAAYQGTTGCNYCSTSSPTYPGVEVAYNYYKTSNLAYLRSLDAPLGVPLDNTFLGFTTYTYYNVPGL
jgi:hypothetical protein